MSQLATKELHAIFDARRVKAPELRGLDQFVNGLVGYVENRRPHLSKLRERAERVDAMEPEIKNLGATHFPRGMVADQRADGAAAGD